MCKGGMHAEKSSTMALRESREIDMSRAETLLNRLLLEISREQDYAANAALRQKEVETLPATSIQDIVDWAKEFCYIDITLDSYGFPSYWRDNQPGPAKLLIGKYGMDPMGWILHELTHWIASTPADRNKANYGLDHPIDEDNESLTPEQDAIMIEFYLAFKSGHGSRRALEERIVKFAQEVKRRDPSLAFSGFTTEFSGRDELISILRRIPEKILDHIPY